MQLTATQELVKAFFKDQAGNPIILTRGQDEIFTSIASKTTDRLHVMCHTRFGKSMTVGLAVLTRAATFPEKWAIIAGTRDKAKIIMDYVISHIFDNDYTEKRFTPDKGDRVDEIRRYRNKNRITFKVGEVFDEQTKKMIPTFGEVFIGSASEVLGFGAENVVEDESALIEDNDHSLVMRMLGDNPQKNFLVKIGNPFSRNHFLSSYHDPRYKKVIIDCYKSLEEGRITQDVIEENRPYSFFKVLYECKFPSATEVDDSGWMYLITDEDIANAKGRKNEQAGVRRIGVDVARGGRNFNAWVLRTDNYAKLLDKNHDDSLISVGDRTINYMAENGVKANEVYIDDSGVGGGVTDYLKSRGLDITPVKLGERGLEDDCLNIRAEIYAGKNGVAVWLKRMGMLDPNGDWSELLKIRYKKDYTGKIKLEPKEDMRKRGVESPDIADALALTFANSSKSVYYKVDPALILFGANKVSYL
jgi:hypothetical protein